jgi:Fe2+ or Zn2+ uptake regulation protein
MKKRPEIELIPELKIMELPENRRRILAILYNNSPQAWHSARLVYKLVSDEAGIKLNTFYLYLTELEAWNLIEKHTANAGGRFGKSLQIRITEAGKEFFR